MMEPQYLSHTLWLRLGGNKFPIARDPDLFQLLPPKPKGPALKKCGRVGTRNTLTIGSEKRGGLNSLIFLFQVLSFCKVWVLLVLFLFGKGNGIGRECFTNPPLACFAWRLPPGTCQPQHQPTPSTWCCPWALPATQSSC